MEDPNDLFFEEPAVENPPDISEPVASQHEQPPGNELEDIPLATKKKRNLKPVPKLDVSRLMGPRGLPCLNAEFENVTFRGNGYEVEDLDLLMSHLEHWAHRLYPRMTFDDCLEKVEKLGHKKEIQTCMKKLRMDMPLLDSDQQTTVITEDGPQGNNSEDEDLNFDKVIGDIPSG
uniref:TIMELESS-interacting protein-like n=1 Tax=Styela clava TaxID=7725 RepID=UPI00193A9CE2|nr:TIMELESS-interacting protein-like [Styela clava]